MRRRYNASFFYYIYRNMQVVESPSKNYKKSKLYYRISSLLFLWLLLFAEVIKQISLNAIVQALIFVLRVFAILVLTPLGIFFLVKSYSTKEPFSRYRILYAVGYLLFVIFLIFILIDIVRFVL